MGPRARCLCNLDWRAILVTRGSRREPYKGSRPSKRGQGWSFIPTGKRGERVQTMKTDNHLGRGGGGPWRVRALG